MPSSTDNQQWVIDEINRAIRKAITPPSLARKFMRGVRDWGLIATCITVPVALLGLVIALGIRVVSDVREEANFRTHTTDRLDVIESQLRDLRASRSPGPVLKELGVLNQPAFAESLPALQEITKHPIIAVAPAPDTLKEVAFKLNHTSRSVPDYWITTLQFIRWASSGMAPDAPPPGEPNLSIINSTVSAGSFGTVRSRVVLIDRANIQNGVFENCRIKFTENPSVLQNISFISCVFELPVTDKPSAPIKAISGQLLAGGIQHAIINLS